MRLEKLCAVVDLDAYVRVGVCVCVFCARVCLCVCYYWWGCVLSDACML